MTILLSDPRVAAVPLAESGEALVRLPAALGAARALVRSGLAARLVTAHESLPDRLGLRVVEGHRSLGDQRAIIERYDAEVSAAHPGVSASDREHLVSRFVSPVAVAPHVAGAAVDLTLVDRRTGRDLDLGTPVDATPEASDGACYLAARNISDRAWAHRDLLAGALGAVGLVNYPTEWWHWSYGDRYWALLTDAPAAVHGPIEVVGTVGAGGVVSTVATRLLDRPGTRPLDRPGARGAA